MPPEILVRYLHFVSILAVTVAIFGQHLLLRPSLPRREVQRLAALDLVYALAVLGVLGTGLLQWHVVGKPAVFYSSNLVFHAKLGLFGLIGIVSIYPTIFFARNKKGEPAETVILPPTVVWSVRLELLLLLFMPLLATLMARGIGLKGS
jgi:putative membrane protein